jgi:formylmethanofuran dehydrogenase subunit A
MTTLCISGGTVYDPSNGVDGVVTDIWVRDGKVVAPPADGVADRTLDAAGLVVMPGGVDMHSHVVGPKVNAARRLRPDDRRGAPPVRRSEMTRSGTAGSVPSTFATGYLYAGLGYTTAVDAAVPPYAARHAHLEFADTPVIDKAFLALVGDHRYVLEQVAAGESGRLRDFLGWLLGATSAYGLKVVNPGGVEAWKQAARGPDGIDDAVTDLGVTPRQIVTAIAAAADELRLPHPVHVHCNHLGLPGNAATTLATMQALDGRRAHLTHVQFHSYGGSRGDPASFASGVPGLADYFNAHPNLTADVGQVLFGDTTAMTGDSPLGHFLHKVTGRRWTLADAELEAGCGVVPVEYKEKAFVHALQWAAGLEWFLLAADPWRLALTTDHPNGGAFVAYPEVVALLMSRDYRREVLKRLPAKVKGRSTLADLDREYTLGDVATVTRAAPARILGMTHKGHLGIGADGDITAYTPSADRRAMFGLPRYVIKAGRVVVEQGEVREDVYGPALCVEPEYDPAVLGGVRRYFEVTSTVRLSNYGVHPDELPARRVVVPAAG